MTARVEGIWSKRSHRGPMDALTEATLAAGQGIEGSIGRSTRRQVTVLSKEAWDSAMSEVGRAVDPGQRRANILVSGIELARTRGRILRVGTARLMIGGELTPCERMDEAAPGLRDALASDWRGGVFAQVTQGGIVRVGDQVEWEAATD